MNEAPFKKGDRVARKRFPAIQGTVLTVYHEYYPPHRLKCEVRWDRMLSGGLRMSGTKDVVSSGLASGLVKVEAP
jgi:hypothetical protein